MTAQTTHSSSPSSFTIWFWLVALLAAGLLLGSVPMGKPAAVFLIFSIATVKAVLVARHYMHLRSETLLVLAIAVLPVLLLVTMTLLLVPDIVFNR